ncbi:hypothetical protein FEE96_04495 [Parasedimentitalea maritima]|uniref:Uncharacterized protein n=1 Tax=Parasedimentitalea maritima TaxID=2578117 RepID=A0ABY2UY41_9RHOB|nr:hypothetical protein [Zongyanglinia marina]TLP67796.1 hypothetical protein FEE96_04495 [Zongyanglinia marina]
MLNPSQQARDTLSQMINSFGDRFSLLKKAPPAAVAVPVETTFPTSHPEDSLSIPVMEHSADDVACRAAQTQGQFLARQERWDELSAEIKTADLARDKTLGGMPIAELLAFGARADVINAVEHALSEGHKADARPLIDGIMALEAVRQSHRDDPYLAAVIALAHIDIGWTWRGTGWETIVPAANRRRCAAHFDRANALLAPFDTSKLDSPMLAAAKCALLPGRRNDTLCVANDYELLIDLDPQNNRHMRALGNHMLPRWFGSYPALELEARRTASRTESTWGAGGYTWVYFDALIHDEQVCAQVDVDFFLDGLRDIVATRPNQETINLLASYCSVALTAGLGLSEPSDMPRMQIAKAADWLVRDHLQELHPMVWAHAADGFDNNARITSPSRFAARGRADALQIIADLFRDEINRGHKVTFTTEGPQLGPT